MNLHSALNRTCTLLFAMIVLSACSTASISQERLMPGVSQPQVTLSGYGEVEVDPDMAAVSMSVSSIRRVVADAKNDVDQRINDYLDVLADLSIDEDDIVAGTLRTTPQYRYNNNQRVFTGYSALRNIEVTVRNLEQLDAVMQSALDAKIDNIGNIRYLHSDEESLRLQARERAIEDSKQKAELLARAYDAELGPIRQISYQSGRPEPITMQAEMFAVRAVADGGGQYLPDQITYRDSIQVVFDLITNP